MPSTNQDRSSADLNRLLVKAIEKRNLDILQLIIQEGININAIQILPGDVGRFEIKGTFLHYAVCLGWAKGVRALLEAKADIDSQCNVGRTPLQWALMLEEENIALNLIRAGANLTLKTGRHNTILHLAAKNGLINVVRCLLDSNSVSLNLLNAEDETAIELAIMMQQWTVAAFILRAGSAQDIVLKIRPDYKNLLLAYAQDHSQTEIETTLATMFPAPSRKGKEKAQHDNHELDNLSNQSVNAQNAFDKQTIYTCQGCFEENTPQHTVCCDGDGEDNEKHAFCFDCVNTVFDSNIQFKQPKMKCRPIGCHVSLSCENLEQALGEEKTEMLQKWAQRADIMNANIEDLVSCPFCEFPAICTTPEFTCPDENCQKTSCVACKSLSHGTKTCQQARLEKGVPALRQIEEARTKALIRFCPSDTCNIPIVKSDGCNKITCECKTISCYVCRKDISDEGYAHFSNVNMGDGSDGKCILMGDTTAQDEQAMAHAQDEIIRRLRAEGVNDPILNLHDEPRPQAQQTHPRDNRWHDILDDQNRPGHPPIIVQERRQRQPRRYTQTNIHFFGMNLDIRVENRRRPEPRFAHQ